MPADVPPASVHRELFHFEIFLEQITFETLCVSKGSFRQKAWFLPESTPLCGAPHRVRRYANATPCLVILVPVFRHLHYIVGNAVFVVLSAQ